MYAQEMKLPEGKKCAAFISVNLAAEFFWLSLDKKAAEDAENPVHRSVRNDSWSSEASRPAG